MFATYKLAAALAVFALIAGLPIPAATGPAETQKVPTPSPSTTGSGPAALDFTGAYCEGMGDVEALRLIDDSFHFFHAGGAVPNLTHLYKPEWDTLVEGFGWGGWWIQNSYGFSYCATPFLQEPWITLLQQSWDLHWTKQGDGIRMGRYGKPAQAIYGLVGPDGSLGDAADDLHIVYKQGDGDVNMHDWYYEGAAAIVVMQGEILLRSRDIAAAQLYLPKMHRACEFIEKTRDPENNLFLVGPASNLLAPSYGGIKQPDGTFGKAYLSGLSITYTAAVERMVELYKLVGDGEKQQLYERRLKITRESLPRLLADGGYFVKSLEQGGMRHGVVGQEHFGYFEGVANADALCFRVADDATAKSIHAQMLALPELRPFDFMLANAPGLDDTYWNYGARELGGYLQHGDWVNGGVWGTVEGRAIMGYYRLGAYAELSASASRAMKWAKDYRMDAPWSQRGENTFNWWSDAEKASKASIMIDNFAIPAATVRGLFEWIYKSDRVVLYPHIPDGVTFYRQKEPVWFGGKRITVACLNGAGPIDTVTVNGTPAAVTDSDHFSLLYSQLPEIAHVVVVMKDAPLPPSAIPAPNAAPAATDGAGADPGLPETLAEKRTVLDAMLLLLVDEPDTAFDRAFVREARDAIFALSERRVADLGPGYFRPMTEERAAAIVNCYEAAASAMYDGLKRRMAIYQGGGDPRKRRVAEYFVQAGGNIE